MELRQNPFSVLGITPESSIEEINDAAENLAFMNEDMETTYEQARMMLTSPNRRLCAEVRWIFSNPDMMSEEMYFSDNDWGEYLTHREQSIFCAHKLSNLIDSLHTGRYSSQEWENLAIQCIRKLDNSCFWMFDSDEINDLLFEINSARTCARIDRIHDPDMITDTLRTAMREDILPLIHSMMQSIDIQLAASLLNTIVSMKAIGSDNRKGYHEIIEEMISSYNEMIQNELTDLSDDIQEKIENIEEGWVRIDSESDLDSLLSEVKQFDFLAQPLQLYFLDRGESKNQEESNQIGRALRDLGVYFNNEQNRPDLSKIIIDCIKDVFPELPGIYEQTKTDEKAIDQILRKRDFVSKLQNIENELSRFIVRENGHEAENRKNILNHKDQWLQQIDDLFNHIIVADDDSIESFYGSLAATCSHLASGCTWGDLWELAYQVNQKAVAIAGLSKDKELQKRLSDDNSVYSDGARKERLQKERMEGDQLNNRNSKTNTSTTKVGMNTVNPDDDEILYEEKWGLIPEDHVKITKKSITFNNWEILFKNVQHIRVGSVLEDFFHYHYLELCCADVSHTIKITEYSSTFDKIVKLVISAVGPQIFENMILYAKSGKYRKIGSIEYGDSGVLCKKGFFSRKTLLVPWQEIQTSTKNGRLVVSDGNSLYKTAAYLDCYDVIFLEMLINAVKSNGFDRLSQLLD